MTADSARLDITVPINREDLLEELLQETMAGTLGVLGPGQEYDPFVDIYWSPNASDPMPTHCGARMPTEGASNNLLRQLRDDLEAWWQTPQLNRKFVAGGGTVLSANAPNPVNWTMGDVTLEGGQVVKQPRRGDENTWLTIEKWNEVRDDVLGPLVRWKPPDPTDQQDPQRPPRALKMYALQDAKPNGSPKAALLKWAGREDTTDQRFVACVPESQVEDRPITQWIYRATLPTRTVRRALNNRHFGDSPADLVLAFATMDNRLLWRSGEGLINNGQISVNRMLRHFNLREVEREG